VHLVGFIIKKYVTMHGHMKVKLHLSVSTRYSNEGVVATVIFSKENNTEVN